MNKAVFLDRDGVINVDKGYVYRAEDCEYLDGMVEKLKKFQKMGYLLIIITNQSGIARGYFSEEQYLEFERWLIGDLKSKGVIITDCYYCPHHPEAVITKYRKKCCCRKPGTELFYRAARDYDIDINKSIVIGDRESDLEICKVTQARAILLDKGWNNTKFFIENQLEMKE